MRLNMVGHSFLGKNRADGIRYVWQLRPGTPYIESAAFTTRAKIPVAEADKNISAYTTSVSAGCALTPAGMACRFCRTGNTLRFSGFLSAEEIALQNIYMVLADIERHESPVSSNLREFAYMGQGEPGFSYTQLRQAIRITDKCMHILGQKVHRHILATCGVVEMVDAFMDDLRNNFFQGTRITFHYSLHAARQREKVMPVDFAYNHNLIIQRLPELFNLTGEKPCVGVLLFKNYTNGDKIREHSTDEWEIDAIANLLDPNICRISLSEFNPCDKDKTGKNEEITPEEAARLEKYFQEKGFQVKLFASFGRQENTACGLLGGTEPDSPQDAEAADRLARAKKLIESAISMENPLPSRQDKEIHAV